MASYVKTRAILQSIEGYNPDEYEEMGFLISYPRSGLKTNNTTNMAPVKSSVVEPSPLDKLNNANATKLSVDKEVILSMADYKVDAYHVNSRFYNKFLRVKHIEVTNMASFEKIELDSYL